MTPFRPPGAELLLGLRLLPGLGDRGLARLVEHARSEDELLKAAWARAERWSRSQGRPLPDPAAIERRCDEVRSRCRELGVCLVGRGDRDYPPVLEELSDPPPVLFLRGDPSLLDGRVVVAVVGARRSTAYGRRMAEALARELTESGALVSSGLALGIDGAAHRAALGAGGTTLAVLGSGPDVVHPRSHRGLFTRIAREGLLVTEFPPGEPPRAHHFPRRNRILAALAEAVVVVEAARGSGAIITANHALALGREVLAVPGNAEDPRLQGNLDLFRDGARVASEGADVLRAVGRPNFAAEARAEREGRADPDSTRRTGRGTGGADEDEALLLSLLAERGPQPVDALIRDSGLPAARVLSVLGTLELLGRVTPRPGRVVALVPRAEPGGSPAGARP